LLHIADGDQPAVPPNVTVWKPIRLTTGRARCWPEGGGIVAKFVTYEQLRGMALSREARMAFKSAGVSQGKDVFLSHSSGDHELLPAVILVLEQHGGRVYVDEQDSSLRGSDFESVAARLRTAVHRCPKFVLFVSAKTDSSKWIPWELGIADGAKQGRNVALFPSAERAPDMSWAEQEYLGLYHRVVIGRFEGGQEEWMVLNHRDNTAVRLREWLTRTN